MDFRKSENQNQVRNSRDKVLFAKFSADHVFSYGVFALKVINYKFQNKAQYLLS